MSLMLQPSPDWDMVTLRWYGNHLDGSPALGSIEIAYNGPGPMLDPDPTNPLSVFVNPILVPITTTMVLIDSVAREVGFCEVRVPASNDPDILGGGGSYSFTEKLTKGGGRLGVPFFADKDAPGGVIYLNTLAGGTPTPGEPLSVVTVAQLNALTARVVELEETPGGPGSGLSESQVQDIVAGMIVQGANVTVTFNATTRKLTIAASGTGGSGGPTDAQVQELARDAIAAALRGATGSGITVTPDDAADTLTLGLANVPLAATADSTANSGRLAMTNDERLRVSGIEELARDTIANALRVATGSGVTITPDDAGDIITFGLSNVPLSATADSTANAGRLAMTNAERTKIGQAVTSSNGTVLDTVVITATAYAALATKVATTQYLIVG